MLPRKTRTESTMVGMPRVWQRRFTGCWWLEAYWEIHCSLVRLPSMGRMIQRLGTSSPRIHALVVRCFGFRVLQFLPGSPDLARDSRDGSRNYGSRLEFAGIGGIIGQ